MQVRSLHRCTPARARRCMQPRRAACCFMVFAALPDLQPRRRPHPHPADKTWRILEDAIHEIHNQNASGLSFEELYRCVCNAAGWPQGFLTSWRSEACTQLPQQPAACAGPAIAHALLLHTCQLQPPPHHCSNAYNMVLHKYGDRLYNGVVQALTRQLQAMAARIEAAQVCVWGGCLAKACSAQLLRQRAAPAAA